MEEDAGADRLSTLPVVDPSAIKGFGDTVEHASGGDAETVTDSDAERMSARWPIVLAVVLLLLAGGALAGGVSARRAHQRSEALDAAHTAALVVAKDCVAATQPPNAAALPATQAMLAGCSTGEFGDQSTWYGEVLRQAYQAVDVRVRIPEMHAAVEHVNDDGSIAALVVFRATVSQSGAADRDNSYRVRVKLVPVDGQFKVAELDQVAQ